jgi:hypothetical protein
MSSGSTVTGNVGVNSSDTQISLAGGTVDGSVNFAGTDSNQNNRPPNFGGTVTEGSSQNVAEVAAVTGIVDSISSEFGAASGASLTINPGATGNLQTVNAASGTLQTETINGVSESAYVFNVSGNNALNLTSGTTLDIAGTASQNVVINVNEQNGEFNGGITLSGGLTANNVIFNIIGSGEFQNGDNGAGQAYTLIDLNGNIDVQDNITGHIYGGDGNGFNIDSGGSVTDVPNLAPAPEPGTWMAAAFLMVPIGGSVLKLIRKRSSKI